MVAHASRPALISALEYLRREKNSKLRHEYVSGVVCEMAGASRNHLTITRNLHGILYGALRNASCQNLDQDVKVWIGAKNAYYYPDATISCPPNFIDEANGVIDNPTVVFEVLSPGTQTLDRGVKFADYRTLESVRDYVLIDSESRSVEVFSLESGNWVVRNYSVGRVHLPSIDLDASLDELYRYAVLTARPDETT